jgi:hypothetical protein
MTDVESRALETKAKLDEIGARLADIARRVNGIVSTSELTAETRALLAERAVLLGQRAKVLAEYGGNRPMLTTRATINLGDLQRHLRLVKSGGTGEGVALPGAPTAPEGER